MVGADHTDFYITDEAKIALAFLRLRAVELCIWLHGALKKEYLDVIQDHSKDVIVMLVPGYFVRTGASASVSIFLALLKLFFGCELKEKVAVTGVLSLSGYILTVDYVAEKAKGALDQGAQLVVAPSGNRKNASERASFLDWEKVKFVRTIVEVLELTVKGEAFVCLLGGGVSLMV